MFDRQQIKRILDLHNRSYRLLLWVNRALGNQKRTPEDLGEMMGFADTALKWFHKCSATFPAELRPSTEDMKPMANLFVSYLATSFEIVDRIVPVCRGCFCCGIYRMGKHLRARDPSGKARKEAHQLKCLYLEILAEESDFPLKKTEIEQFLSQSPELSYDVSLATYVRELIRRTSFASQGEGVLTLWRDIAWAGGRPKKGFELTSEEILRAESAIVKALRYFAETLT